MTTQISLHGTYKDGQWTHPLTARENQPMYDNANSVSLEFDGVGITVFNLHRDTADALVAVARLDMKRMKEAP